MFSKHPSTESALSVGVVLALLWGVGISLRGLLVGPMAISWTQWFLQLTGGIACALIVPWLLVRATNWVSARVETIRHRPQAARIAQR